MKNMNDSRRLGRRGFLTAAGAGAVATVTAATWNAPAARAADVTQQRSQVTDAVLAGFQRHRLIAIGEIHGQQEHHDALQAILADPRLPDVVDDIVVEFGNALYQPVMDRFTAGGAVDNPALRLVWRNTTQSPVATWDAPVYEQFFRMVRAANWTRPPHRQIRVLLGDPPIDWPSVTTNTEVNAYLAQRDTHMAAVVEQEVLAKGRRALVCYGSMHVLHTPRGAHGGGGVAMIEQRTRRRAYVIVAAGHPRLSPYPRRTVIPCEGTWLESADAAGFDYFPKVCGVQLGEVADAVLYLGQVRDQTQSLPNPAIYLDPVYWAELQRRDKLGGNMTGLAQYRQEQPMAWPGPGGGPSCPPAHR